MRNFPEPDDKYDQEELKRINAEPWMLELLKLNPEYTYWGPHEDYMCNKNGGWGSPIFCKNWQEFRHEADDDSKSETSWNLDVWNECVHFYFEVERASTKCLTCGESGYNPETRKIADDFYDFNETGRRWCDNITQDEVDALIAHGRLHEWSPEKGWYPVPRTAEEVNAVNRRGARGPYPNALHSHDAINRHILIETRARRLGVYGHCPECDGHGTVYTEPAAHVNLVLWILHPRKGACRGVEIKNIQPRDLPEVFAWLREAAQRNAERFSKIPLPETAA